MARHCCLSVALPQPFRRPLCATYHLTAPVNLHTALSFFLGSLLAGSSAAGQALPPPRIEWNPASLTLVQAGGNYARIVRLPGGGPLVCAFELAGKVAVRRSTDEGRTWTPPTTVAAWPLGSLSNPELLALRNGTLLCFFNERPRGGSSPAGQAAPRQPFAIALSRSADGGNTWSPVTVLYRAGTESGTGCWEPAAVELPNGVFTGEIQLFFANEQPYPKTAEQEISLLRSTDGGHTWSGAQAASFRAGSRDGMPVPVVLRDNAGVALAIEDNGLSGTFKPGIVFSDLATGWRGGPVRADSPRRWGALAVPLPPAVYAGAPYLRQMPGGETVLSFQQGDDPNNLRSARMAVSLGDRNARNFGVPSFPFPPTPGRGQLWNSLFVKDAQTITAVTSAFLNGQGGVWTMDGRVVPGSPTR